MSLLWQPTGIVSASAGPSDILRAGPSLPPLDWQRGAGLLFAREAEVALRTALIGISASVVIMGCFPGTKLPCLKNVWLQSKHASALAQPLPWVLSARTWCSLLRWRCGLLFAAFPARKEGAFPCQAVNLLLVK